MFNEDYMYLVENCGYLVANSIMEAEYSKSVNAYHSGYSNEQDEYRLMNDNYYYEAEIYNDEELYRMAKKF